MDYTDQFGRELMPVIEAGVSFGGIERGLPALIDSGSLRTLIGAGAARDLFDVVLEEPFNAKRRTAGGRVDCWIVRGQLNVWGRLIDTDFDVFPNMQGNVIVLGHMPVFQSFRLGFDSRSRKLHWCVSSP